MDAVHARPMLVPRSSNHNLRYKLPLLFLIATLAACKTAPPARPAASCGGPSANRSGTVRHQNCQRTDIGSPSSSITTTAQNDAGRISRRQTERRMDHVVRQRPEKIRRPLQGWRAAGRSYGWYTDGKIAAMGMYKDRYSRTVSGSDGIRRASRTGKRPTRTATNSHDALRRPT